MNREQGGDHDAPVTRDVREVRVSPKVVMWIALAAGLIALIGFSSIFYNAGYRNGWW